MKRTRRSSKKKTDAELEVLVSTEFSGFTDSWTEHLCMDRQRKDQVILSSRSRELLCEASRFIDRNGYRKDLPATFRRKAVWGFDGDFVVGERLVPHDGGAEVTVWANQFDVAEQWLKERKWWTMFEFREAWPRIHAAIASLDPTSDARREEARQKRLASLRGASPQQHQGDGPREIVVYCDGCPKPGITWLELVFLEWGERSFSVFTSSGDVFDAGAEVPRLVTTVDARLTWRQVLAFIRSSDLAKLKIESMDRVLISGLEPWQTDVVAGSMLPLVFVNRFLRRLPDGDLKALHRRLGGLLSSEALDTISELAQATQNDWLRRKSLTEVAKAAGAADPNDYKKLLERIYGCMAQREAESMLALYGTAPAIPVQPFLRLLDHESLISPETRTGLFELWLRSDPKPTGGSINDMNVDDEFPVLHWLLRWHAAEVFAALLDRRADDLRTFVVRLLGMARSPAEHFEASYRFHSFNEYTYGRPRYAECARLGFEVEQAANVLGIEAPQSVRLPAMPNLDD